MADALKSADIRAFQNGGKPRAAQTARNEATPKSGPIGAPPDYFTADQVEVWLELAGRVDPGLLQASDAHRFGQLVIGMAIDRKITAEWNKAGQPTLIPGKRGGRSNNHPLYVQLRLLRNDLAPLIHEFGLNPIAKQKVKVQRSATVSPLDRFTRPLFPEE